MIARLRGQVAAVTPTTVIIDVGGVGFTVLTTPGTSAELRTGAEASLHTHLAVREDALTLYGFATAEEREAFVLVQSVTGIGPKLALAIVAHLTAGQLRQAILTENLVALAKVPGVGRKTAQRLVLELKDKALTLTDDGLPAATTTAPGWRDQVVLGLQSLGYSARDAESAWEASAASADDSASVSDLMKAALRTLAKG
ncbi:MAG: Holliday junction branch migration protein RuvA [Propionibacteriaceae bacterium]|jgi:Holliday junction DNA helicase RuvA|nr:Holliday junction branch migration protein RuvA [Propionibacteriaceae bacterium]